MVARAGCDRRGRANLEYQPLVYGDGASFDNRAGCVHADDVIAVDDKINAAVGDSVAAFRRVRVRRFALPAPAQQKNQKKK